MFHICKKKLFNPKGAKLPELYMLNILYIKIYECLEVNERKHITVKQTN